MPDDRICVLANVLTDAIPVVPPRNEEIGRKISGCTDNGLDCITVPRKNLRFDSLLVLQSSNGLLCFFGNGMPVSHFQIAAVIASWPWLRNMDNTKLSGSFGGKPGGPAQNIPAMLTEV